jgi:hypothetical protein
MEKKNMNLHFKMEFNLLGLEQVLELSLLNKHPKLFKLAVKLLDNLLNLEEKLEQNIQLYVKKIVLSNLIQYSELISMLIILIYVKLLFMLVY